MTPDRFQDIAREYQGLRLAVVGDFCLDRYLEICRAREDRLGFAAGLVERAKS